MIVLTTTGSKAEAGKISEALVEERLCACVQVVPIISVYRWKGKIEREGEHLLLCKTVSGNYGRIEERILQLHSYECPEVVAIPIVEGSKNYLSWIRKNTEG
ncbi:MAG: divalent-cation tolerance protein CutA [Candidatus Altiarchaeota archaeon]